MEALMTIFILAIILEAVIQVFKGFVPKQDGNPEGSDTPNGRAVPAWLWPVVGAVLGIVLCVAARVDILALVGIPLAVPYLGSVLAGVIISRGASFVHDVWKQINGGAGPSGGASTTGGAGS